MVSDNIQADHIEVFNYTSRYLDDLLNSDTLYFEQMVCQIYQSDISQMVSQIYIKKHILKNTEALFGLVPVRIKWHSFTKK